MNPVEQPLVDLAPLLEMLALGTCIALLPLAWVFWRNRGDKRSHRWQALTVLTLFLTFDLVLFGAFTRLTDSGLGCPDWPGCYGTSSPLAARAEISAAQAALPSGPVTHSKAWIEMVHRYLATGVGGLIALMAGRAWWLRWQRRKKVGHPSTPSNSEPNVLWATVTLAWVCIQGLFGALTVTMKLFPAIVTLHLAGGLVLLALLCVQAVRQSAPVVPGRVASASPHLRTAATIGLVLLAVQVFLGGWVSTNYAVLACSSFPTCQGSWWPEMNFAEGFQLWRPLGETSTGAAIGFSALTAIHYVHRLFAYVVFLYLGWLALRLRRMECTRARAQAWWLAGLLVLQFATGLGNVVLGWPLVAAVLHTGGAAALVVVLTWIVESLRAAAVQGAKPVAAHKLHAAPREVHG